MNTIKKYAYRLFILLLLFPAAVTAQEEVKDARSDGELLQRAQASRTYGTDTLLVTVHEFADPACGSCEQFHTVRNDSLKNLLDGKANFVYHFTPIPGLMRGYHGAKAALCAGGVGDKPGFEAMLNSLFAEQENWSILSDPYPSFEEYAKEADLPIEAFKDCYDRDAVSPLIVSDLRLGGIFGAPGTPTFAFVEYRSMEPADLFYGGDVPMSRFEEALSNASSSE